MLFWRKSRYNVSLDDKEYWTGWKDDQEASDQKRERFYRWWGEECGTLPGGVFETGQIPRFVGSEDLLPRPPTCLECLYNVSFLRHRCLSSSPSSFAHWYSHYSQLANTPSVVYPLEISLFLQFRPPFLPSFLPLSFPFSPRWKAERWFSWLLFDTRRRRQQQQQSCHEQRLRCAPFPAFHYTPCHARGRCQLRKGIKHPRSKGAR